MTSHATPLAGPFLDLVEPATLDDVPQLAEMGEALHAASKHRALNFSRPKVEALLAHLLNDASGVVFVSRSANRIVGACAGAVLPSWYGTDLLGMEYAFFVEPGNRNEMRGTTLVLAFTRWCQRRGAKQVRLGVTTAINDLDTARLYRSLGFVDSGTVFSKEL